MDHCCSFEQTSIVWTLSYTLAVDFQLPFRSRYTNHSWWTRLPPPNQCCMVVPAETSVFVWRACYGTYNFPRVARLSATSSEINEYPLTNFPSLNTSMPREPFELDCIPGLVLSSPRASKWPGVSVFLINSKCICFVWFWELIHISSAAEVDRKSSLKVVFRERFFYR